MIQRGCFQPNRSQYGCDRDFPLKSAPSMFTPSYGPWKNPNIPKRGHEKLISGYADFPYAEQMEKDQVRFHERSEKKPVWNPVTPGKQLSVVSVLNN